MCIEEGNDEPLGLGHWMIDVDHEERVKQRIACLEKGYPESEAMFPNIKAWEEHTGKDWYEHLNI